MAVQRGAGQQDAADIAVGEQADRTAIGVDDEDKAASIGVNLHHALTQPQLRVIGDQQFGELGHRR